VANAVPAALLAAAATAGALVGFGMRDRAPGRLLAAAGEQLRGVPAFVTPDRGFGFAAWLGVAHHVVVVAVWSLLFAFLAGRLRGLALAAAAAAFGVAVFVIDGVLPGGARLAAGTLAAPQRLVVVGVLTVALGIGMRLAPRERRQAARAAAE
jgi:hypothetical protein